MIAVLAFGLLAGVARAAPGDLDASFGQGGRVGIVSSGAEYALALAVQADGRIVVAGHSAANAVGEAVVYRLKSDGSLDGSFNGNGRLGIAGGGGDSATAVAVQRDGKILVAGKTAVDNTVNAIVYRLNPDGSFDASFGTQGARRIVSSAGEGARALALQPDGKIIVAGDSDGGATRDAVVYRLNPDGSFDQTFNGTGRLAIDGSDFANAVALQRDGRIVLAGRMPDAVGKNDAAIWRLTPNGSFDPFNGNGRLGIDAGGFDEADPLAVQPDGRIVTAGSTSVNAAAAVWRVAPTGSLDPSFDGDGVLRLDEGGDAYFLGLAVQPDGRIVAAGSTTVNDNGDAVVHRVNPDGSVDARFGHAGKVGIGLRDQRLKAGYVDLAGRDLKHIAGRVVMRSAPSSLRRLEIWPCSAVCALPGGRSPHNTSISCAPGTTSPRRSTSSASNARCFGRARGHLAVTLDDPQRTKQLNPHLVGFSHPD